MQRALRFLFALPCLFATAALASTCPTNTISVVDVHNETGVNGQIVTSRPSASIGISFPEQSASYDLPGSRVAAAARLFAAYNANVRAAHSSSTVRDEYKLIGPPSTEPIVRRRRVLLPLLARRPLQGPRR